MQIRRRAHWILASGALFAGLSFSWAQGQSQAVVVKATRHAISPPLGQLTPLPPASSGQGSDPDEDAMPVRRGNAARTVSDAALQSPDPSPLVATPLSTSASNPGVNILGLGTGFSGFTDSDVVPDTNVAVGPTQVVEFVNDSFAIFDKSSGSTLYSAHGNTLWQNLGAPCSSNPNYDEIAQFDKLAQRWVMLMPNFYSPASLCIAVSTTTDALNGSWNLYSFTPPKNTTVCNCEAFTDYPKLAVWPDGYYISYNEIWNGNYIGAEACVVDRNSMLSGDTATMQCFSNTGSNYGSFLPGDVDGTTAPPTGSPEYYLNFDNNDESLDLWQFHVDWTTPANSWFGSSATSTAATNIPVTAFIEPCGETVVEFNYTTGDCIPQANSSVTLDSYGDRLMYRLAYRNFGNYQALVANQTVQLSSSSNQTGIRWYELQDTGSGFSLFQEGTYAPDSSYRWMGSIAMDQSGDIAVGYSVSSSAMSPSIRYAGRVPSDPSGQLESEIDILSAAGITPGSKTGSYRWADYSSMTIDSADDCTFWFATEYVPTTGTTWGTRIASFNFPTCGGFTVTPSPLTATVSPGSTASFTVATTEVGSFSETVTLSCSTPTGQGINCSFSPTTITPGASTTLSVTTTGPSASMILPPTHMPSHPLYAVWMGFPALVVVGIGSMRLRAQAQKRRFACAILCAALLGCIVLQMGCGGGSKSSTGSNGGTAAGTYTVSITATSGTIQHTASVSVTVQ